MRKMGMRDEDGGRGVKSEGGRRRRRRKGGRVRLVSVDKDALTRATEQLTSLLIMHAGSIAKSFVHFPGVYAAGGPANGARNNPALCTTTTP
jgi:hypothetical protein